MVANVHTPHAAGTPLLTPSIKQGNVSSIRPALGF